MLLSTFFALFALTCQAVVSITAASLGSLREQHQHKLRHQHSGHGKHSDRQSDVRKYGALENLLRAALKIDREETVDGDYDLIEEALKKSLSRRNRSLDNGVLEQQSCQIENLISCDDYTGEKECHVTATGMSCCRCRGQLIRTRRRRSLPS